MKEALVKLINVKTIVTLVLTTVFAILSLTKQISSENFMTIFCVIIAFYFGTIVEKQKTAQSTKSEADATAKEEQ